MVFVATWPSRHFRIRARLIAAFLKLVPVIQSESCLIFSDPLMIWSLKDASHHLEIVFFVAQSLVCRPLYTRFLIHCIWPIVIELHILKHQFSKKCWLVTLLVHAEWPFRVCLLLRFLRFKTEPVLTMGLYYGIPYPRIEIRGLTEFPQFKKATNDYAYPYRQFLPHGNLVNQF